MVKNRDFSYLLALDAPVRGSRRNINIPLGTEKIEWSGYLTVKKSEDTCNRFYRKPACDGQTDRRIDGQTAIWRRHSPRYAYASRGKNIIASTALSLLRHKSGVSCSQVYRRKNTCFRQFLPRDAMHKRGLCRRAVSVCPSRSCILLKRINVSSFFLPSQFFRTKRYDNIPDPTEQKSRFSVNIWLWHRSLLDRRVSSTFRWCSIDYSTMRRPSAAINKRRHVTHQ